MRVMGLQSQLLLLMGACMGDGCCRVPAGRAVKRPLLFPPYCLKEAGEK